jgi:hypothetical protein
LKCCSPWYMDIVAKRRRMYHRLRYRRCSPILLNSALKGNGSQVEFKCFNNIIPSLTKNIFWFWICKMLLWWPFAIAIFCAVKVKNYWRNNIYWRFLQNHPRTLSKIIWNLSKNLEVALILLSSFIQWNFVKEKHIRLYRPMAAVLREWGTSLQPLEKPTAKRNK